MIDNIAILNNRGVLTLPEEVGTALSLHTGSCLEVTVLNGEVVLKPLPADEEADTLNHLWRSRDAVSELQRERREEDEIARLKHGC